MKRRRLGKKAWKERIARDVVVDGACEWFDGLCRNCPVLTVCRNSLQR